MAGLLPLCGMYGQGLSLSENGYSQLRTATRAVPTYAQSLLTSGRLLFLFKLGEPMLDVIDDVGDFHPGFLPTNTHPHSFVFLKSMNEFGVV